MALTLGALVAGGQVAHALWLLREALAAGYDLPAAAWNGALQLLVGQGDWQRALALHRAMQLARVRPDATTAGLLAQAAQRAGDAQLAQQVVHELGAQGLLQQEDGGAAAADDGSSQQGSGAAAAKGGGPAPPHTPQMQVPLSVPPQPNGSNSGADGPQRSSSVSAASIASSNSSRLGGAPN